MPTPTWSGARAGLLGDPGAVNASAQVNQFLGAHGVTPVYQGASILTPVGSGGTAWQYHLDTYDIAQPFTMSGTSIGRVVVPVLPVGNGADMIVGVYANNAGVPGARLNEVRVPAAWINQLAAVSAVAAPSSQPPIINYTDNPLALSQYNSFHMGVVATTTWTYPIVAPGFGIITGADVIYPGYIVTIGGVNGSTYYNNVFSIAYDNTGHMSQAIPQPVFPTVENGGCGATFVTDSSGSVSLVAAGGSTAVGVHTNIVYTAGFDPVTGVISAWTSQASLPQVLYNPCAATWNGYVYIVGGINNAGTPDLATVYYTQVQNNQITAWSTATPMPVPLDSMWTVAINGFLVVFGGATTGGGVQTACWFAPIHADGSLGAWQSGPPLPAGAGSVNFQGTTPNLDSYGVLACANSQMYVLSFGPDGPDSSWQVSNIANGGVALAEATVSDGAWIHYGLYNNFYTATPVTLTPRISVPLPTTGLTNGATYHIVINQPNGDLTDHLRTHDDVNAFPGNPTTLTRNNGATAWTAGTAGHAVPIQIYDNSVSGKVWHLWEDAGARISTLAWGTTPNQPLFGYLDATQQPGPVLNRAPTFTGGTAPWVAGNGTLTRSSAFTHGNLPFSALLTPNGVSSQCDIECERLLVDHLQSYTGSAWVYSPPGYSNCSVILNWYDAVNAFISSTFGTVFSVAAGTWTLMTANGGPPDTAVSVTMGVYEKGTPPNTALLYVATGALQPALGPQVSSVAAVDYAGIWPSTSSWPPLGVTELA